MEQFEVGEFPATLTGLDDDGVRVEHRRPIFSLPIDDDPNAALYARLQAQHEEHNAEAERARARWWRLPGLSRRRGNAYHPGRPAGAPAPVRTSTFWDDISFSLLVVALVIIAILVVLLVLLGGGILLILV